MDWSRGSAELRRGGLVHHVHQGSLFSVMVLDVLLSTRTEKSASYSEVFHHSRSSFWTSWWGSDGCECWTKVFCIQASEGWMEGSGIDTISQAFWLISKMEGVQGRGGQAWCAAWLALNWDGSKCNRTAVIKKGGVDFFGHGMTLKHMIKVTWRPQPASTRC